MAPSTGSTATVEWRHHRKRPSAKRKRQHAVMLMVDISVVYLCLSLFLFTNVYAFPSKPSDADHITANAGDQIVFNCEVEFPHGQAVPFLVQWGRRNQKLPIYIWYDNYPTHTDEAYVGRVSKIEDTGSKYGFASLNITNVTEADAGWYNCKVLFLNRPPSDKPPNGTWYHLEVHAAPYFLNTPEDVHYVTPGDSLILTCHAGGIPIPEILWYKSDKPVKISNRIGVFNDGTELRINNIHERDLGDYTCIARNGVSKGNIHHTCTIVMAGAAVIVNPPKNRTVEEGQGVELACKGQANPANLTVSWFRNGINIKRINDMERRFLIRADGTLIITKVLAKDQGKFACEITNGIGHPIGAHAFITVEYAARVVMHETTQYIPRGLQGMIRCHIEANPPIQFVTWTKDKRIYDPFDIPGVMAMENGSILIDRVTEEHAGDYVCTPFNIHGSGGASKIMSVVIKDPPTLIRRPDQEYHRSAGDKVTLPCGAVGTPRPKITWRRVDGRRLPRKRFRLYNGELTLESLHKSDHGVYECVVANDVATIVARTEVFIERTTPHAPTNVTVTDSETFGVSIEWLPGYSGCAMCQQTYKIRYREKDSKFPNWIELPVNPPDARSIQIHNLNSNTKYEFQVIGTNEYGDGMYSEIIEAQTKGDGGLAWSVYPPTASPSEQSTSTDCIEFNLEIRGGPGGAANSTNAIGRNNLSMFDIRLLPRDSRGDVIYPKIPREKDLPPGEAPPPATNLTLTQEAGGWVLRWVGPKEDPDIQYYTVQIKKDSQGGEWQPLTDQRIDVDEASYMIKNMGTAKAYLFRVFSHSVTSYSISEELKYDLPENVKRRAVTAGLIGGILFFIVAIVLSVCTVKICNKKRRKKQERAINEINRQNPTPTYNMIACHAPDTRNGAQISRQVPFKRHGKSRIPAMRTSNSNSPILSSPHHSGSSLSSAQPLYPSSSPLHVKRGLIQVFSRVSECLLTLEQRLQSLDESSAISSFDEPDYSDGRRRRGGVAGALKTSRSRSKAHLHSQYPTQPGHRPGLISRTKDGRFVLDDEDKEDDDEGGFDLTLPPNRFRTRSVAIVAGYSPERLYSNMPPRGAFVVESGMYKVASEHPEPIYWRQVVYGEGSNPGTLPRPIQQAPQVGRMVPEDIQKLHAMSRGRPSTASLLTITGPSAPGLIRTSNLELVRPEHSNAPRLRASSPLDQQVPLSEWMSPLHNYSDVSTVSHRERSMPSTLLTSPGDSQSQLQSTRSLRNTLLTTRSSELHTIPEAEAQRAVITGERSNEAFEDDEPPPAYSTGPLPTMMPSQEQVVRAEVHHGGLFSRARRKHSNMEANYWTRPTYLAADTLFPNYALNYPAPLHGHSQSISPSRQYPEPPPVGPSSGLPEPRSYWQALYVQPEPVATSSPPPGLQLEPQHDYENMLYSTRLQSQRQGQKRVKPPPPPVAPKRRSINQSPAISEKPLAPQGVVISKRRKSGAFSADAQGLRGVSGAGGGLEEEASVVSEVLDAEVTALTHSSSSPSSTSSAAGAGEQQQPSTSSSLLTGPAGSGNNTTTSSSGIASKNTSSSGSHQLQQKISSYEQPFYENWPPPKVLPKVSAYNANVVQPMSASTTTPLSSTSPHLVPPLIPHQTMGLTAKPQQPPRPNTNLDRRLEVQPIELTAAADSSLDTPPGSAHSAPVLDVSIDRHYEFDTRTPTDEVLLEGVRDALPRQWNRPYLGYDPRRDRDLGRQLARTERVFSDSEIYSPVFPRGRPEGERPRIDVSERVQAMRREFHEYRQQQQQQQQQQQLPASSSSGLTVKPATSSPSPTSRPSSSGSHKGPTEGNSGERLESLI